MQSFDLFLVSDDPEGGLPRDGETIRSWLSDLPHLTSAVDDPTRFAYYNRDTTVHFSLIVHPSLQPSRTPEGDEGEEEDRNSGPNVIPDADEAGEHDDDEWEDEDEEEDEEEPEETVDLPPVALSVPLFRPSFFVEEALQLMEGLRASSDLLLLDPQEEGAGDGEPGGWTGAEILKSWELANRRAASMLKDHGQLCRWSAEQCQMFYTYTSRRAELEERFGQDGLDVPRLHPAAHEGRIKTLCIWRTDKPAILPRCDLVLVQRPQQRRGLLGRKKTVLEEGIASANDIWELLRPFAEIHREPAPFLVFRRAHEPPAQISVDLDRLTLEPVKNARRCELAGVVDLDLDVEAGSDEE